MLMRSKERRAPTPIGFGAVWLRLLSIAFLPPPESGVLDGYGGPQAFADRLIRELPGLSSDARVMASLRNQLPLLAEAAPIPFVDALEALLQGGSNIEQIFLDRGLFSSPFHIGLLWAVEVLAWSPEYLPRVVAATVQMHERFGGLMNGNSALTTLREIFLAWSPGTSASIGERLNVLRNVAQKHPRGTWELLLKLMPRPAGDSASPTQEPSWRDFGRSDRPLLTRAEVAKTYRAYAEFSLEQAESNLPRLLDLLPFFSEFPPEYRERLLRLIGSCESHDSADRLRAWNQIRDFVAKHRSFSDAFWALPEADLQDLEHLGRKFAPEVARIRMKWLFDD
ncbi:MAG TPA: hypothetical protein VNB23_08805, partial [Ramlibacter sp.]|nr:hypothetical protein [Ramlibacter sp.]